jgi:tRNA nucleotidyltransferase (CCA-adding enzyme)
MDAHSWTHFEHEADIGLAATSVSREGMFEAMGAALTGVVTDPAIVQPQQRIRIQCSADDDGLLMVDWINSLIYEMATRRMLFGAWRVSLRDCELDAWVDGEPVDRERHQGNLHRPARGTGCDRAMARAVRGRRVIHGYRQTRQRR